MPGDAAPVCTAERRVSRNCEELAAEVAFHAGNLSPQLGLTVNNCLLGPPVEAAPAGQECRQIVIGSDGVGDQRLRASNSAGSSSWWLI